MHATVFRKIRTATDRKRSCRYHRNPARCASQRQDYKQARSKHRPPCSDPGYADGQNASPPLAAIIPSKLPAHGRQWCWGSASTTARESGARRSTGSARTCLLSPITCPGYDGRPATSSPRDPCAIAAELHDRLAAEGRSSLHLLVGHSLGEHNAYLYPRETAALVLGDAKPPDHLQAVGEKVPAAALLFKAVRSIVFRRSCARNSTRKISA